MKPFNGKLIFGHIEIKIIVIDLSINYSIQNPNYNFFYPNTLKLKFDTLDYESVSLLKSMNCEPKEMSEIEISFNNAIPKTKIFRTNGAFDFFIQDEHVYSVGFVINELPICTSLKEAGNII